ncbi:MAG: DUF423 domain-containing protein [Bacteroidetes bacterium]|nr:DUF423 domain-containing protein [Bacteroidota bacterium]
MYKPALVSGILFAALAVILGAFGAHYLKTIFTADLLQSFETGVRYQFYHAIGLLCIGFLSTHIGIKASKLPYWFMLSGILLFSGSIYILCFLKSTGTIGLTGIGALTPIGGVCFIVAWILLVLAILKSKETN